MKPEIRAAKHLGQHFLRDQGVIDRLVRAINPQAGESLLEIGPGLGALTLPILAKIGRLRAVEYDRRAIAPLTEKARTVGELTLIEGDILQQDLGAHRPADGGRLRLIGNLPYNLSSPILFFCLAQRAHLHDMHFMLQKEVVARIVAAPGSKTYGRMSVMLQQYLHAEALFDIPPQAFIPPPKVDSAVVRLTVRGEPAYPCADETLLAHVVKTAFARRRKMLRKSLAEMVDAATLQALEIDPTLRAENLDGAAFARIADELAKRRLQ